MKVILPDHVAVDSFQNFLLRQLIEGFLIEFSLSPEKFQNRILEAGLGELVHDRAVGLRIHRDARIEDIGIGPAQKVGVGFEPAVFGRSVARIVRFFDALAGNDVEKDGRVA